MNLCQSRGAWMKGRASLWSKAGTELTDLGGIWVMEKESRIRWRFWWGGAQSAEVTASGVGLRWVWHMGMLGSLWNCQRDHPLGKLRSGKENLRGQRERKTSWPLCITDLSTSLPHHPGVEYGLLVLMGRLAPGAPSLAAYTGQASSDSWLIGWID